MRIRLAVPVLVLASAVAQLAAADPALGYVAAHPPTRTATGTVVSCPSTKCVALSVANAQATGNGNNNNVAPVSPVIVNANGFSYWVHTVRATYVGNDNTKNCGASDFQIQGSPATVNAAVPAKSGGVNGTRTVTGLSIKFIGSGQCRSATVTLSFTVS